MSTTSRLRSASSELIIRPVANGYLVTVTREPVDRFGGLVKERVSPDDEYVFSGATAEANLGDFVQSHFEFGRPHLAAPTAMDEDRKDNKEPSVGSAEVALPEGLPPLPVVPSGFTRWVARGMGWHAPALMPDAWAATEMDSAEKSWTVICNIGRLPNQKRHPMGYERTFYLEAVK